MVNTLNVVLDHISDIEEEKLSIISQDDSYQEFCFSEYDGNYTKQRKSKNDYTILNSKKNLEVIIIYSDYYLYNDLAAMVSDLVDTIFNSYAIYGMDRDSLKTKLISHFVFNRKIDNLVLPLKEFFTVNDDVLDILKNTNIKKWYHAYRKQDEEYKKLNSKATFYDMLCFLNAYGYEFDYNNEYIKNIDYYDVFGIDCSDIREVFFTFLSDTINCDYDLIYYLWLDNRKALYHFCDKDNNLLLDFNLDLLDYARRGAVL